MLNCPSIITVLWMFRSWNSWKIFGWKSLPSLSLLGGLRGVIFPKPWCFLPVRGIRVTWVRACVCLWAGLRHSRVFYCIEPRECGHNHWCRLSARFVRKLARHVFDEVKDKKEIQRLQFTKWPQMMKSDQSRHQPQTFDLRLGIAEIKSAKSVFLQTRELKI